MSAWTIGMADLLAALALPPAAIVQQRVPKKMLAENGAASLSDRKLVQEGLDELTWHAALKPTIVGVAAYEDGVRSYVEVAVLIARLRTETAHDGASAAQAAKVNPSVKRMAEVIHRAVPYPTLLLMDSPVLYASMAHLRWAQREAEKTVLDGESIIVPIGLTADSDTFLAAMPLSKQPRSHMLALYQGWFDTLSAWQAVELTGHFKTSESPAQAAERRSALRACKDLDARIAAARSAAAKQKQMARQVAANLEIKVLLAERQQIMQSL